MYIKFLRNKSFVSGGSSLASVVSVMSSLNSGNNNARRFRDKPYFDDVSARNVTAVVGQNAELSCHVKHPGNRTVIITGFIH